MKGTRVKDKETNNIELILDETKNSFLISRTKLAKEGISCSQWFTDREFEKKFEIINIQHFFKNIREFNIWFEGDTVEELDDVNELLYEIELIMYNSYLNELDDTKTEKYLNKISGYYIKDIKGNKIYFTEFVPYIYQTDSEWRMKGDEKYQVW